MSNFWSRNDKLFVDGKLEVLSFELSFAPSASSSLPMERRSGVAYDGPKGDEFKGFLLKMGYRVNNKGRVIVVGLPEDEKVEAFHYFLLDKVVPLGPFGFPNQPFSKWKEVMELKSLLDKSKAELAKKNDELNESRRQLDDLKTELLRKNTVNLENAKFDPPRVLVQTHSDFLGFCRRMNRTYVNPEGDYVKFEFTAIDAAVSYAYPEILYYCDEDCWISSPFMWVQYDESLPEQEILSSRKFYEPSYVNIRDHGNPGTWLVNEAMSKARNCLSCAFTLGQYRFIGQMTRISGTFRNNALVSVFFDQSQYGKFCYVDALATTFFVLETEKIKTWDCRPFGKPPRLLD